MIKRIEIDGYRLLDGFKAEFRDLTVVVGANAVGKSTLLDCMQCLAHCTELPLNTAIRLHGGIYSILSASRNDPKLRIRIDFDAPNDYRESQYEN